MFQDVADAFGTPLRLIFPMIRIEVVLVWYAILLSIRQSPVVGMLKQMLVLSHIVLPLPLQACSVLNWMAVVTLVTLAGCVAAM